MNALLASGIGLLVAAGIYLMLRARTFDVVIGLTLFSYAVNLFIFVMGRVMVGKPPIVDPKQAATLATMADPLPQALVLTAIVISFGMTALLLAMAVRGHGLLNSDHVNGQGGHDQTDAFKGE
jgi:multicomponent K+:H+ antiporter subunit C